MREPSPKINKKKKHEIKITIVFRKYETKKNKMPKRAAWRNSVKNLWFMFSSFHFCHWWWLLLFENKRNNNKKKTWNAKRKTKHQNVQMFIIWLQCPVWFFVFFLRWIQSSLYHVLTWITFNRHTPFYWIRKIEKKKKQFRFCLQFKLLHTQNSREFQWKFIIHFNTQTRW